MVLFTHLSLISLCNVLLIAGGLHAVARSKSGKRRFWLFATLWSYFIFTFLMFGDISMYAEDSHIFYLLQYPLVLSLAFCTCEFSFATATAAGIGRPKHFRLIVGILTVIWSIGMVRAILVGGDIFSLSYTLQLILPIGLIIFNVVYLGWAVTRVNGVFALRMVATYHGLLKQDNNVKALGGLFVSLMLCVIGAAILLTMRESTFAREYLLGMFALMNTAIIGTMVLTHLNFVEERLELSTKITGVLLVAVLASSSVFVMWLFEEESVLLPQQKQILTSQSIVYEPQGQSLYKVSFGQPIWDLEAQTKVITTDEQPAIIELPFPFEFYGKTYSQLLLHTRGYASPYEEGVTQLVRWDDRKATSGCFGNYPVIVPFCSGLPEFEIYMRVMPEKVVFTWYQEGSRESVLSGGTSQLQILPNGQIILNYRDIPELGNAMWHSFLGISSGSSDIAPATLLTDLPVAKPDQAIWFDLSMEQRITIHERAWPIVVLLCVITFVLLFVFKRYLDFVLVVPLDHILSGLKKVDEGRLDIAMRDTEKDEFGDIARGFNRMLASLNDARQKNDEQTELLETELTYRTIETATRGDEQILSKDEVFEQRIREVIEANMDNFDFQVAELAEEMAVSTRQLHRKVVTLTAKTPAALVRNIRLERAHQLLSAQAVNVSEAAYKTGFRDVGYFSKLFAKRFNLSPSELLNS